MLDSIVCEWVERHIDQVVLDVQLVGGGKNNKAFLLRCKNTQFFLKQYYTDNFEDNARFVREVEFYTLLNKHKIDRVAQLLKCESDINVALFDFVPGNVLSSVNTGHIEQAASFIYDLNQSEIHNNAKHIQSARGHIDCVANFFKDIENRYTALLQVEAKSEVEHEYKHYLTCDVAKTKEAVFADLSDLFMSDLFEPILSPSDFGFHNSLASPQLTFFDFEYAGWDSAEKLVTDFFAQPRYNIDCDQLSEFISAAFPARKHEVLVHTCKKLLPLAKLKWALIFLNEFKAMDVARRAFSGHSAEQENYLQNQLAKSRSKLSEVII